MQTFEKTDRLIMALILTCTHYTFL